MYITNLGIRITHLQNSFQVQQMAGDAAPSRGTTRLKHFHQPEEPHTDSPCLSISKAPGKNLSLGHLAGEWIPKQLSTFSVILEVQRKKKKSPAKYIWEPCIVVLSPLSLIDQICLWQPCQSSLVLSGGLRHWYSNVQTQNCYWKTRLQGTTLQRTYFSLPAELTSLFHWKLDGVSQTIVKFLFLNST